MEIFIVIEISPVTYVLCYPRS